MLDETFQLTRTRASAQRLEIESTPKHRNGLNLAETELSLLNGQRLNRYLPDLEALRQEVRA